jgi:hypothetical protein
MKAATIPPHHGFQAVACAPPGLFNRVFLRQQRKKAILGITSAVRANFAHIARLEHRQ